MPAPKVEGTAQPPNGLIDGVGEPHRRTDGPERDLALILAGF
jgi:hypothetical protein